MEPQVVQVLTMEQRQVDVGRERPLPELDHELRTEEELTVLHRGETGKP